MRYHKISFIFVISMVYLVGIDVYMSNTTILKILSFAPSSGLAIDFSDLLLRRILIHYSIPFQRDGYPSPQWVIRKVFISVKNMKQGFVELYTQQVIKGNISRLKLSRLRPYMLRPNRLKLSTLRPQRLKFSRSTGFTIFKLQQWWGSGYNEIIYSSES